MFEPTPNLPLLRKVLEYVDAHPEEWDQRLYVGQTHCGTVACVAGWACLLNGDIPLWRSKWGNEYMEAGRVEVADGEQIDIAYRAQDLLRLTSHEAADLFADNNTRADVQRVVDAIAARAGERL